MDHISAPSSINSFLCIKKNDKSTLQIELVMKILFLFILINLQFLNNTFSQTTGITQLETEILKSRSTLSETKLDSAKREKIYTQLAFQLNELAEEHFDIGEYEFATKLFVEADQFTKQYYVSYISRRKQDLLQAEKKLLENEKEENTYKKEVLCYASRVLISVYLSDLISNAHYLHDIESEKIYLQKLSVVAHDNKDSSAEAKALEKLGDVAMNEDHPNEAFALFDKAYVLRTNKYKEEWIAVDYIAYAHQGLGEYDKATEEFEKEIKLLKNILANPINTGLSGYQKVNFQIERLNVSVSVAQTLSNIARIKILQGKYGKATDAVNEVENIIQVLKQEQKTNKDETLSSLLTLQIASQQANSLRIRARILQVEGKDSLGLINYLKAVKLYIDLSGGKPSGAIASIRTQIALIYTYQKKFDEARSNIKEVLRLRARLGQEAATVYALISSSRIERAANNKQSALKFARQAKAAALQLTFSEDIVAEANENEGDNLVDKAADQNSLELEQAIVGYKTAIAVYRQSELLPMLSRALSSLGWAYERSAKFKEAEASYNEAIKVSESIKAGFSTSEESEAFSGNKETISIYKRMVDLLLQQGKTEQALQYASNAQRRNLIDAVPKSEIKLNGASKNDLKNIIAAENRIGAVRLSIEKENKENHSEALHNNLVSDLGAARQQYAISIKRLETEQPNLRFTVRPTDLLKLQSSVANSEAIISYLVTSQKLYIFVVKRNNVAVRTVDITQDNLRGSVAFVRMGLTNFSNDFYSLSFDPSTGFNIEKERTDLKKSDTTLHYKNLLSPLRTGLNTLYEILIKPVEDLLIQTETLKIIPNSELFLLPYSALLSGETNQYLIERYNIIYLTAGDLISSAPQQSKGSLVAFGNPTEANLEGALDEVKAIRTVFQGSKIYTDSAATKQQLFKLKVAKILHFATHGHIRSPLENSNIQLAHLPGLADADLSYGEIYALPIESSEMVVLSACQTALGTVSGTEIGVFIEAFRSKTNTVVASLWSVDDIATLELMKDFYKNLQAGKSKMVAMRSAQLKLLKNSRTKNPLFWSAFVMYGDGGKISGTGYSK